jgi:hypothetical protein
MTSLLDRLPADQLSRLRPAPRREDNEAERPCWPCSPTAAPSTTPGFSNGSWTAYALAARHPDRLTTAPRKQDRNGRLYLDVQRNAYAQTAVAPYAVRALPGAPVATPLTWDELEDPGVDARRWTLKTVAERLDQNPWQNTLRHSRSLTPARRRLAALVRPSDAPAAKSDRTGGSP